MTRKALAMSLLLFSILYYLGNVSVANTSQGLTSRGLGISSDSPVEFVLTDPQGRRTGFDPVTKTSFHEIPVSDYATYLYCDEHTFSSCNPPDKQLSMANQMPGLYVLDVIGTGIGDFRVEVEASDATGNRIIHTYSGTTAPGRTTRFTFPGEIGFFAAFEPNLKITSASNAFEVHGTFTLGPGGAISPATQPLSIQLGNYFLVTIPAHSFQKTRQGAFVFKGAIRGISRCTKTAFDRSDECLSRDIEPDEYLDSNLTPIGDNKYAFNVVGTGWTNLPTANPIEVQLAIGNNGGRVSVDAHFAL